VLDAVVLWCVRPVDRTALIFLVGLATVFVAGSAVFRVAPLLVPGLALLGAAFMAIDGLGAIPRPLVVPYAFGLFLIAELGYESTRSRPEPWRSTGDRGRLLYLSVVAGCSLVVSIIVLVAAAMLSGGVPIELVGLSAAVGTTGLVAVLITKPGREALRVSVPDKDSRHDRRPPAR
jgi:hypothetical protein